MHLLRCLPIFCSVSGEQMTHLQMSMQTAGISLGGTNRAQSSNAVNLFLSEYAFRSFRDTVMLKLP
jgi:hypothetical protein